MRGQELLNRDLEAIIYARMLPLCTLRNNNLYVVPALKINATSSCISSKVLKKYALLKFYLKELLIFKYPTVARAYKKFNCSFSTMSEENQCRGRIRN